MRRTNERPRVLLVDGPSKTGRWLGRSAMALLLGVGGVGVVGMIRPTPEPPAARAAPAAPAPQPDPPAAEWAGHAPDLTVAASVERPKAPSRSVAPTRSAPDPAIRVREPHPYREPERRPARDDTAAEPDPSVLPPGRLFISARPWGRLYVDDRLVGTTPVAGLALAPGPHRVRVVREGFSPWERAITVAPDQAVRLIDVVLQEVRP
jgi:hypothetical protein